MDALSLGSADGFRATVAAARSVRFGAYVLPDGPTRRALLAANTAGAEVRVRLAGAASDPPEITAINRASIAVLRASGIDAELIADPGYHLKAAVVDDIAYLDDANFRAGNRDVILRDAREPDVRAVAAAIDGASTASPTGDPTSPLALKKSAALAMEAQIVATATPADDVAVSSESFGPGVIADALAAHARAGGRTALVVSARELTEASAGPERRTLAALAAAGVLVRVADQAEKLCIAGTRAWIGSANATSANAESADWGASTSDPHLVAEVRDRLQ